MTTLHLFSLLFVKYPNKPISAAVFCTHILMTTLFLPKLNSTEKRKRKMVRCYLLWTGFYEQ